MLHGFFTQFKKYRYSGMKVNIVPAAQLPADPLQISYAAGTESYIDPRDLQNPVLFHGVHGSNMGDAMNMVYSLGTSTYGSASKDDLPTDYPINQKPAVPGETLQAGNITIEDWYYSSILDPSYKKFNVMSNMSLPFMSPRVHTLATDLRIQPSYTDNEFEEVYPQTTSGLGSNVAQLEHVNPVVPSYNPLFVQQGGGPYGAPEPLQLISSRTVKLGWLDTFTMTKNYSTAPSGEYIGTRVSPLPKIMMGLLVLPPSYRTQLCFRMICTHYFEFARFNTSVTPTAIHPTNPTVFSQSVFNYHNWLPDIITEESLVETASIDALNGEVNQTVSGVL